MAGFQSAMDVGLLHGDFCFWHHRPDAVRAPLGWPWGRRPNGRHPSLSLGNCANEKPRNGCVDIHGRTLDVPHAG